MKELEQEQTEGTETGKEISVISVSSCSNPFVPSAGSEPMKPTLQQEQTEVTEELFFSSLFPLFPPVQIRKFLLVLLCLVLVIRPVAGAQTAPTNLVPENPAAPATNPQPAYAGSASCRECHAKFYSLWSTSFHGLAMQPYTAELAKTKLTPQTSEVVAGPFRFRADLRTGMVIERTATNETRYPIVQTMGGKNVYYFLTPLERGWLQVLPVAYDVRRQEWFDTTASAMRHFGDRRDEALYWKERQLTFNTSCFSCHVSQLSKNYDLKSDSYHTTWAEPGINCETCHGPSSEHAPLFRGRKTNPPPPADLKLVVISKLTIEQRHVRPLPRQDVAGDGELRAGRTLLRSLRSLRLRERRFLSRRPRPGRELHLHPVAAEPVRQVRQAGLHPLPHLERALPLQR
jgi:hypothetical protein